MSQSLTKGYPTVMVCERGVPERVYVHVLVLEAFVGARPDGLEACHNDGDSTNNRAENLRWDTRSANMRDKEQHGTSSRGVRNASATLTAAAVRGVRLLVARGESVNAIAEAYGVSPSTIVRARDGVNWSHVRDEGPVDLREVRKVHGNRKVTSEQVDQMAEMRRAGASYPAISRALGVPTSTVYRHLKAIR